MLKCVPYFHGISSFLFSFQQAEAIVKLFKEAARVPGPTSARILECSDLWGKMVKFQRTHLLDGATSKAIDLSPVDVSNE